MPKRNRPIAMLPAVALAAALASCGDDGPTGLALESCGPLPYFTVLPVALQNLSYVSVVGSLGAPGHTLPTAHVGLFLRTEGAPVIAPGRIQIDEVRRTTYVSSPTRQGFRDYALFFSVCKDVHGWFGHLTSLAPGIPDNAAGVGCTTYSTSVETVEACTEPLTIVIEAGERLGTGGLSIDRGFAAVDFGLLDRRVHNTYVSPSRHPDPTFTAVCPYEYFDSGNRQTLLGAIRDGARPGELPTGQPRCGTMVVDVAGTAKGVWAETGVSGPVQGDETRYITLADDPYHPGSKLALSLGPAALGARVAIVPRQGAGRVNRAFEEVLPNGVIHCYNTTDPRDFGFGNSWLIALSEGGSLRIERVEHIGGEGPCGEDPDGWAFGAGSMAMFR